MAPVLQNIPLACRKTVSQGIFGLPDATNLLWKQLDCRGTQIQYYLCLAVFPSVWAVIISSSLCGTSLKDHFISVHRFEAVYVFFFNSLQRNSKPYMSDDLICLPFITNCIIKVSKQCISTSGVSPRWSLMGFPHSLNGRSHSLQP